MDLDMKQMIRDHVDERIYHMQTEKTYTFEWLLGDSILASTTELERMYLERMLNLSLAFGELEIYVDGLNEEGRTLYRRVD